MQLLWCYERGTKAEAAWAATQPRTIARASAARPFAKQHETRAIKHDFWYGE